ncbi:MAG: c-type cytochrome [Bryobacteraceae bacterium]|nr:c-type cytochrome [Bryobacteraceae bacterium]
MSTIRTLSRTLVLLNICWVSGADLPLGDSSKGERLFETQQCIRCHKINGTGGTSAPDLGRPLGRNLTPALLAGTLWNHAPAMWSEMRRQGIEPPAMSTQDAGDLFAFFYSARYFDKPGDAGRGRNAFSLHHCADCHSLSEPKGAAPAVATWQSLGSPVALAEAMWNHSGGMRDTAASRGVTRSQLSAQDLSDIYVYLRNHPSISPPQGSFEIHSGEGGEALLEKKGCLECHRADLALAPRLRGKTINDIASAMWNHSPGMTTTAGPFRKGEMTTLLSYVWAKQFFEDSGDAVQGEKVYRRKSCATCHLAGQGPQLTGNFTTMRITSALWNHGPAMLQQMESRSIAWPRFNNRDMANLVSYLNSKH